VSGIGGRPRDRIAGNRLALAEGVSEEQARGLAREGKAVVWIDGGLHANEVLGSQQLIENIYEPHAGKPRRLIRRRRRPGAAPQVYIRDTYMTSGGRYLEHPL